MDERSAEVTRVLRVLAAHAAEHAKAKSSAAAEAEAPVDAYEILALEPSTPSGQCVFVCGEGGMKEKGRGAWATDLCAAACCSLPGDLLPTFLSSSFTWPPTAPSQLNQLCACVQAR